VIKGDFVVPHSSWDERVSGYRCEAMYYRDVIEFLSKSDIPFRDSVTNLPPCPVFRSDVSLRSYQGKALELWSIAGRRGVVVLPTGAGKTVIAIRAIELVNRPSIVVVPTLDLLYQWKEKLEQSLGVLMEEVRIEFRLSLSAHMILLISEPPNSRIDFSLWSLTKFITWHLRLIDR